MSKIMEEEKKLKVELYRRSDDINQSTDKINQFLKENTDLKKQLIKIIFGRARDISITMINKEDSAILIAKKL
jgi:hypothetical protein